MLTAITRAVSRSISHCELTHLERQPIDVELARRQHNQYEQALRSEGVEVLTLPEEPALPDSVFVEDTAIVLEDCAILTRPGAKSRQPEVESIAKILALHRSLFSIQESGCMDGGDVLVAGRKIYVGLSSRSNRAALDQMQVLLAPYGYSLAGVRVDGCLHLKSAVTRVDEERLLINPAWVDKACFSGMSFIEVDPAEPWAANVLQVGGSVLCQPSNPRTSERLIAAGLRLRKVDVSELAKAEGALTCCSLIFNK